MKSKINIKLMCGVVPPQAVFPLERFCTNWWGKGSGESAIEDIKGK